MVGTLTSTCCRSWPLRYCLLGVTMDNWRVDSIKLELLEEDGTGMRNKNETRRKEIKKDNRRSREENGKKKNYFWHLSTQNSFRLKMLCKSAFSSNGANSSNLSMASSVEHPMFAASSVTITFWIKAMRNRSISSNNWGSARINMARYTRISCWGYKKES